MDVIWAPWRMEYIMAVKDEECVFCRLLGTGPSDENYLLVRTAAAMAVLNLYPYNNGHILIAPNRHVGDPSELGTKEYHEVMDLFRFSLDVLRRNLSPDGFNAGMNLGKVGGAGIADHIHWHIVPRWNGDTNFMPVVAGTRVVPESLKKTYEKLRPFFVGYEKDQEGVK